MDLPAVEDMIKKMHETGKATKELMANTTHASGAVVGGASTPQPPITPQSSSGQ